MLVSGEHGGGVAQEIWKDLDLDRLRLFRVDVCQRDSRWAWGGLKGSTFYVQRRLSALSALSWQAGNGGKG